MDAIKCKVLDSIKNDNFLEVVYQSYLHDRNEIDDQLGKLLSELHNSDEIDILVEFSKLNQTNRKHDFFILRNIFSDALPHLEAPVIKVMQCVKHISNQDGDVSHSILLTPFVEYCKKTPSRIDEVLSISLDEVNESLDFISPSLIAGSNINTDHYSEVSVGLVNQEKNLEIIKQGIFALGCINYKTAEQTTVAFNAVKDKYFKNTDLDLSVCLRTLFNIYTQNLFLDIEIIEFIKTVNSRCDDTLIYTVSNILLLNKVIISESVENLLLEIASKVNPEQKGTINSLDFVLMQMIDKGHVEQSILVFERICENSKNAISIQEFDSFSRKLIENPNNVLYKTITKWFLSQNISLCKQASELLSDKYTDRNIEVFCDLAQVKKEKPFIYLYLTRKAIGWFFLRPISAISFVISILDDCPDDQLDEIFEITFHPLLISYPGSVKKYLESKVFNESEKVSTFCKDLILKLDDYHNGLNATSKLKELKPSGPDRYAYNRQQQILMNESVKSARKSSLISALGIHESILLYGNKSIHYIYTGNGSEKFRQETAMHQISTSVEFPSLHVLDPHRLDWMLRYFRIEGYK